MGLPGCESYSGVFLKVIEWNVSKSTAASSTGTNTCHFWGALCLSGSHFSTYFAYSNVSCHMKPNLKALPVSCSTVSRHSVCSEQSEVRSPSSLAAVTDDASKAKESYSGVTIYDEQMYNKNV